VNIERAAAYANNEAAFVIWQCDEKLTGCLGFSIRRINVQSGNKEPLPAWVPFKGQSNIDWKPKNTDTWPVQKFNWRDLTPQRGKTYKYEIVPVFGTPETPQPNQKLAIQTNEVELTSDFGDVEACFNNGLLSTQFLAHLLPKSASGIPDVNALRKAIFTPGNKIRNALKGDIIELLSQLIDRAKNEGGSVYLALYELNDPELVKLLKDNKDVVHLILSNTGPDDAVDADARAALHSISDFDITDRMLKNGHIGHNKSAVYVDKSEKPVAILSGSTNWTPNGLCAQSNNAIIIESETLANAYKDYWDWLKDDDAEQSEDFRMANQESHEVTVNGQSTDPETGKAAKAKTDVTVWFSPNTKQQTKPKNAVTPVDLADVFSIIEHASEALMFLVFEPGSPSIIDTILETYKDRQDLFVRGAVSVQSAMPSDPDMITLIHKANEDPVVVSASALKDDLAYFEKELLSAGNAIIHDKIVVVDPLSPDCVVITGSHNLGYRASYCNDENLLIIRGNQDLAKAYAVHILDVYDHYRFRFVQHSRHAKFSGFLASDDSWQNKYFTDQSYLREQEYWTTQSMPPAHAIVAPPSGKQPVGANPRPKSQKRLRRRAPRGYR